MCVADISMQTHRDMDEINKLCATYEMLDDVAHGFNVPINCNTNTYMNIFNTIQMEMNHSCVLTQYVLDRSVDIDLNAILEGQDNVLKRLLDAIRRFINDLFFKISQFFKKLFSYRLRFELEIDKLRKRLEYSEELSIEKLQKTQCRHLIKFEDLKRFNEYEMFMQRKWDEIQNELKKIIGVQTFKDEIHVRLFLNMVRSALDGVNRYTKKMFDKGYLYKGGYKSKADIKTIIDTLEESCGSFDKIKEFNEKLSSQKADVESFVKNIEKQSKGDFTNKDTKRSIRLMKKCLDTASEYFTAIGKQHVLIIGLGLTICKKALTCVDDPNDKSTQKG